MDKMALELELKWTETLRSVCVCVCVQTNTKCIYFAIKQSESVKLRID